jgi:hypothetical protein
VLLIVLGCALAPISVLGVWTANQVSDTDRYIANVTPLIREPAVRGALTDKIAAAVSRQVDVQGVARQAATQLSRRGLSRLSALLSNFSGSIASAVNGLIHGTVAKAVSRPLAPDAAAGSGRRGGRTRVHLLVKPDRPGCAADRHHARGRAQPDRTARQASGQAEDRAPRQLGRGAGDRRAAIFRAPGGFVPPSPGRLLRPLSGYITVFFADRQTGMLCT